MQYIPTKLTTETLKALLGAPGKLAYAAYLLLCELRANCPANGDHEAGWLGSDRRLTSIYCERTGKKASSDQMGRAVEWLESAGLLTCEKGTGNCTRYLLWGATPNVAVPLQTWRHFKRGTLERGGCATSNVAEPPLQTWRSFNTHGSMEAGSRRASALVDTKSSSSPVDGGRAASPLEALAAEADARGVPDSMIISAASRSADSGRSVVTIEDVARLSGREIERVRRYIRNTHPLEGEEPPPSKQTSTSAKPTPDQLSKLTSALFASPGAETAVDADARRAELRAQLSGIAPKEGS